MGLNRIVKVTIKDLPEDHPAVGEIAELLNVMYDVGFIDGEQNNITDYVNWWDMEEDMKLFSLFFPDLIFEIEVKEGDGYTWIGYYKNGKEQICESRLVFDKYNPKNFK